VPVATRGRAPGRPVEVGNRLSGMLVSLATDVDHPVARLHAVAAAGRVARTQERLAGGRLLADVAEAAPPALLARLARAVSSPVLAGRLRPVCNVVVSNVPGPDRALWCAGSRVGAVYPVGPVAAGVGLNVTCMTYQGTLHVGVLGCRRLVPDVRELAGLFEEAVGELVSAALQARGAAG
ncbi:MAG: WS/DGAT domain-containing protein, partial [Acidimicrobiales bacterium]